MHKVLISTYIYMWGGDGRGAGSGSASKAARQCEQSGKAAQYSGVLGPSTAHPQGHLCSLTRVCVCVCVFVCVCHTSQGI